MVAPAKAAVWRKFESVILPNEDDVASSHRGTSLLTTSATSPRGSVWGAHPLQGQDRTVPPLGQHKCASAPPPVPEKLRAEFHQPCTKNIVGVQKTPMYRLPVLTHLDVAPSFYPATIGVWSSVMPCWAVVAAVRGAKPSVERSAADRRARILNSIPCSNLALPPSDGAAAPQFALGKRCFVQCKTKNARNRRASNARPLLGGDDRRPFSYRSRRHDRCREQGVGCAQALAVRCGAAAMVEGGRGPRWWRLPRGDRP